GGCRWLRLSSIFQSDIEKDKDRLRSEPVVSHAKVLVFRQELTVRRINLCLLERLIANVDQRALMADHERQLIDRGRGRVISTGAVVRFGAGCRRTSVAGFCGLRVFIVWLYRNRRENRGQKVFKFGRELRGFFRSAKFDRHQESRDIAPSRPT